MDLGWTSDTVNAHDDAWWKTLEMNVHSQEITNVSDVHVSDKDGYKPRSNTIKANGKIVKELIWTLDSRFASKIELQPLDADTDA